MDGETEAAFEAADVVFEEVRVFVEVDVFEGELAESFATVCVCGGMRCDAAAAEFGAGSILLKGLVVFLSVRVMRVMAYLVVHSGFIVASSLSG